MPKQERKRGEIPWKTMALAAGAALLLQLLWQPLWALLIHREAVGPGWTPVLTAAGAGISVLAAVLALGRRQRSGRLVLGCGAAGLFLAAVLLLSLGYHRAGGFPMLLPGVAAAALGGGILAALLGGGGRRPAAKHSRRRR